MATARNRSVEIESLGGTHWLAVALVVATAVLHLYAGVVDARPPLVLAGLGYLGAVGLFLLDVRRRLLYAAGIPYTAVQIVIWAAVNAGAYTLVGYVDKAIQVALVVVLVLLYRAER